MAKYFIIGEAGETELWLVDIDNRTVTPVAETDLENATTADILQLIGTARKSEIIATKGISIAIASDTRAGMKSQSYSESKEK